MDTLKINLFGEFHIQNKFYDYSSHGSKSKQVALLLAYIIAHKYVDISKEKLYEVLWPDEEIDNPRGALRNLVYRCRSELGKFFPDEDVECILLSRNSYSWNPDVPAEIDCFEFEKWMQFAEKEPDPDARYEYLMSAYNLYAGEFMPKDTSLDWVMFQNVYYRNMYTRCVAALCRYYHEKGRYEDVIRICENSAKIDQLDEKIHIEKINAYLKLGAASQALDYYYKVVEMLSQTMGVNPGEALQESYREILKHLENKAVDIMDLEKNLKDDHGKGTFFCSFDIFKNIYQVNLRSSRRSQKKKYLLLFSLNDVRNPGVGTPQLKEDMEVMHKILAASLRSNDVYTQSSPTQFSLILTVANENGRDIVINRITERFAEKHIHKEVVLEKAYRIIS